MIAVAQTCHLLSLPNPDVSGAGADEPEGGKEGKGKEGTTVRAVEALLGLLKVLLQLTQTSEEWCNALLGCGPALGTILRLVLVSAHSLDSAKTETETKTKSKAGSSQDKPKRGSSRPRSPTKTTKTSKAGANTADAPSSPAASASASDANAEDDKEDGEQRASEARALLFDLLCFALGLFTNLLEIVPSVKDDVRKIGESSSRPCCSVLVGARQSICTTS